MTSTIDEFQQILQERLRERRATLEAELTDKRFRELEYAFLRGQISAYTKALEDLADLRTRTTT